MSEVMTDSPSPGGGSPGQAPLSGSASSGGMAPQRPNSMPSVRERWSRNAGQQGSLPRGSKAKLKKGAKKEDLDPKARMLRRKRAALRTLRKERY